MKTVSITDVYDLETSKKGKIYPAGSIMICLAAAISEGRNRPILLEKAQEASESCAVGMPKNGNNSIYLHYAASRKFGEFLHRHISGINLRFNQLEKYRFEIHENIGDQDEIAEMIAVFDRQARQEEKIISSLRELKRYMLATMYPNYNA